MSNTRFGTYYRPVVEEVRVGFEYEVNTKLRGWKPKKLARNESLEDLGAMLFRDLLDPRTMKNYRARYIDTKDVISLGWTENNESTGEDELSFDIRNEYVSPLESIYENHWYMVLTEGEKHIDVIITLHTYSGVEKTVEDVTTATYTIKSKNDLLQLMEFKGITKYTRNQL